MTTARNAASMPIDDGREPVPARTETRFRRMRGGRGSRPFLAELGRRIRRTILSIIGLMMRARNTALMLVCVLFAASASAQSKGNARVNGKILDDQGKPASAVLVRAIKVGDADSGRGQDQRQG